MILVDMNNLVIRTFSSCLSAMYKDSMNTLTKENVVEKFNENQKELTATINHFILNDLLDYQLKYSNKYGELVLCFDSGTSWRKSIYPKYKENRKVSKKATEQEWFERKLRKMYLKMVKQIIKKTRFIMMDEIKVNCKDGKEYYAEADDVIATLIKTYNSDNHIIVSVDSDFIQLLEDGSVRSVEQFNPIDRKKVPNPSNRRKMEWLQMYLHIGQRKDNIPSIKTATEFSPDFIKWAKTNHDLDLDNSMLELVEEKHQKMIEEYENEKALEDENEIASGKRKQRRNLTIYKKPNFGEAGWLKFKTDYEANMDLNPRYKKNLEMNKILLDFDCIPKVVCDSILTEYKRIDENVNSEIFDSIELMTVLQKLSLVKIQDRISEF